MKTIIIFLSTWAVLIACTNKKGTSGTTGITVKDTASITLSILLDKTDPQAYWPTADQLLELYHCEQRPSAQYTFKVRAISDRVINAFGMTRLPPAYHEQFSLDQVEDQKRAKKILEFYQAVRDRLHRFYTNNDTTTSLSRSVCGQAILSELWQLTQFPEYSSILVIVSDLREFSDLNTYAMKTIDPQTITAWLESKKPDLPSLTGITVIFIFTSKNIEEDTAYTAIVQGYTQFLEQRGATVLIKPNL